MNAGTKLRSDRENHFSEFTILFAKDKIYIGNEPLLLGHITTEVLNYPDGSLLALRRSGSGFLKFMHERFYSPYTKKDLTLASATQIEFNKLLNVIFSMPLFNQLNIDKDRALHFLPHLCVESPDIFKQATIEGTIEYKGFLEYITKHITLADELISFKAYVTAMLDIYFENLKLRNDEHYAVGFYRFLTDTSAQQMIAKSLPQTPFAVFRQARPALIEYTTLPNPEKPKQFTIGEQVIFHSYISFLHVDLFRGLMSGNAPRRCHNCGNYFLSSGGYDVVYCNRIAPGETEKTCRKVGAHRKASQKAQASPTKKMYNKVYNRLKQRHLRGKISRDEWNSAVAKALEYKEQAERGELTDQQLKEIYDRV